MTQGRLLTEDKVEEVKHLLQTTNKSSYQIRIATGVSQTQILRIRKKLGLPPLSLKQTKPAPDDFRTQFEANPTIRAMIRHYRVASETVDAWLMECGLERPKARKEMKTPLPADWFALAPQMTLEDAMRHFKLSKKIVQRMVSETGVRLLPYCNQQAALYRMGRPMIKAMGDTYTRVDRAANFLRRTHPNVHRADIKIDESGKMTWGSAQGIPARGQGYYNVSGIGVVTINELMALAEAKGWSETL